MARAFAPGGPACSAEREPLPAARRRAYDTATLARLGELWAQARPAGLHSVDISWLTLRRVASLSLRAAHGDASV